MTLSSKQLTGIGAMIAAAFAGMFFAKDAAPYVLAIAILGACAVVFAGAGAAGRASLDGFIDAARRAASGDKLGPPAQASGEALRLYEALAGLADERRRDHDEISIARGHLSEYKRAIDESEHRLESSVESQIGAALETSRLVKELASTIHEIATHLEALTRSAEESSSSILEMTATNDEVAESVSELAGSVRETASSIEEMAYSIKEVARNVDALSLTAE
ncbi:MAG: hypothetical protein ACREJ3_13495 [Polyangiaceae bacterium]